MMLKQYRNRKSRPRTANTEAALKKDNTCMIAGHGRKVK